MRKVTPGTRSAYVLRVTNRQRKPRHRGTPSPKVLGLRCCLFLAHGRRILQSLASPAGAAPWTLAAQAPMQKMPRTLRHRRQCAGLASPSPSLSGATSDAATESPGIARLEPQDMRINTSNALYPKVFSTVEISNPRAGMGTQQPGTTADA